MRNLIFVILLLTAVSAGAQFPDTGQINPEISRSDPAITAWASTVVDHAVGPQDYQDPGLGDAAYGVASDVLGDTAGVFSLGDGGWITLGFDTAVTNGPGTDLAVFENGFVWNGVFMEIGFVEVSSDGIVFSRLPALCRRTTQPGAWDPSDPTDFYNLAGNYEGGTGIDLNDLILAGDANVLSGALNLDAVTHVRIVDVVGDITGPGGSTDAQGRPVADPYPTASASCGMDLSAVGAIHTAGGVANEDMSWGSVKQLFR